MALTPHITDTRDDDPADVANITEAAYEELVTTARTITAESDGAFLALAGSEWSTNSSGNHLGVLGVDAAPKVERGRFDLMWDGFLPERKRAGDRPVVTLNHPRTFRHHEDTLNGSWDQVFGVNLLDIPKNGERNKKFNDFGLDDYAPLSEVRDSWIAGDAEPDRGVVAQTMQDLGRHEAAIERLSAVFPYLADFFPYNGMSVNRSIAESYLEMGKRREAIRALRAALEYVDPNAPEWPERIEIREMLADLESGR